MALVVAATVLLTPEPASAQPVTVAEGPRQLTVSKAQGVDSAGERITVTGTGYDELKGIYVAFCLRPAPGQLPTPCGGGVDMTGESSGSVWISSNPPPYGEGLAVPYGPGGTFTVEIAVQPRISEDIDCTVVECVVVSRNDHTRTGDRSQDVAVPIVFGTPPAAVPPPAAQPPPAPAPAPEPEPEQPAPPPATQPAPAPAPLPDAPDAPAAAPAPDERQAPAPPPPGAAPGAGEAAPPAEADPPLADDVPAEDPAGTVDTPAIDAPASPDQPQTDEPVPPIATDEPEEALDDTADDDPEDDDPEDDVVAAAPRHTGMERATPSERRSPAGARAAALGEPAPVPAAASVTSDPGAAPVAVVGVVVLLAAAGAAGVVLVRRRTTKGPTT